MGSTEFARAPVMKQSQTNGLRIAPILLRKKGEKHKRIGTTFMARKSVARQSSNHRPLTLSPPSPTQVK